MTVTDEQVLEEIGKPRPGSLTDWNSEGWCYLSDVAYTLLKRNDGRALTPHCARLLAAGKIEKRDHRGFVQVRVAR